MALRLSVAVLALLLFLAAFSLRPNLPPPRRYHYYYYTGTSTWMAGLPPWAIAPASWLPSAATIALACIATAFALRRR